MWHSKRFSWKTIDLINKRLINPNVFYNCKRSSCVSLEWKNECLYAPNMIWKSGEAAVGCSVMFLSSVLFSCLNTLLWWARDEVWQLWRRKGLALYLTGTHSWSLCCQTMVMAQVLVLLSAKRRWLVDSFSYWSEVCLAKTHSRDCQPFSVKTEKWYFQDHFEALLLLFKSP